MTSSDDHRRYSEEEFALVLRMASEVRDGPESTITPPRDGLTLSQIRDIAAEVGIDPDRVSRAAALLPAREESAMTRLVGGATRHHLQHTVSGEVPAEEMGRLVEVARRSVSAQGEVREVLGGLEWKGGTATASFGVSISPKGGETSLQAWTDRTETFAGVFAGVGLSVMGVVAVTMGKLVFGESDGGILSAVLTGLPAGFLAARTLWKRSTEKYRERLIRLLEAMSTEAEAAVDRSEEAPDSPF